MRKITVRTLALALCLQAFVANVHADNISPKQAKEVATYYLSLLKDNKSIANADAELVYQVTNTDLNIAAAYVYNIEDEGYVIVSGSDCSTPIIGFSETGHIDPTNMPPAMKYWLEQYCQPIIDVQNAQYETTAALKSEWSSLIEKTHAPMPQNKAYIQLINDKWGQGETYTPTYNALCPHDNQGRYAVAGCVATAVSMIMHYWKYPRVGKGNIFYPHSMADIHADFAHTYYQYELMPNELKTSSSQDMIEATATLCYHVGAAVKMNYGVDGSGAQSTEVITALPKYFKYERPVMAVRAQYSDAQWMDTLLNEIENGRPIYYAARDLDPSHGSDAAGHAFLCTGTRTTGSKTTFYINWGWDGGSNGFFDMETAASNFHPGGTQYNFNSDQRIIYRITPPADSINVGINHIEEDGLSEAYPNPATHSIVIPHKVKEPVEMRICDIKGRMIESHKLSPSANSITINVSAYPKGVYFYLTNGKAHRFVVQ